MNTKFSIKDRLQSFQYAFNGLGILFLEEHNARIHLCAGIVAIGLGWLYSISATEWLIVILVIAIVFATELFNSAIESLCDHVTPDLHPQIKKIKDLSAAAVLITAVMALIVGVIIFAPKVLGLPL